VPAPSKAPLPNKALPGTLRAPPPPAAPGRPPQSPESSIPVAPQGFGGNVYLEAGTIPAGTYGGRRDELFGGLMINTNQAAFNGGRTRRGPAGPGRRRGMAGPARRRGGACTRAVLGSTCVSPRSPPPRGLIALPQPQCAQAGGKARYGGGIFISKTT
jgi:hypothetical protein